MVRCMERVSWTLKVKVKSLSRVQLFVTPWTVSNKPHIVSDPVMHYFTRHFTMAALLFKRSLG